MIKYRLAKGLELDKEMIEHLQQADLLSKAYNKALDHLSYQLRTKKEIKIYLTKLEVPENDQNLLLKAKFNESFIDKFFSDAFLFELLSDHKWSFISCLSRCADVTFSIEKRKIDG